MQDKQKDKKHFDTILINISFIELSIDLKQNFILLERAVSTFESRFNTRVLRTTASIRKRLNADILSQAIRDVYPRGQ